MNKQQYIDALKKVGIGYLFTLININLGTIDILPSWVAYILFYRALDPISQYEKSASLLEPLNIILIIYEFVAWIFKMFGGSIDVYVVNIIVAAISLYFEFQLLTNIADIASMHKSVHAHRIYQLRNVNTILSTMMIIFLRFEHLAILLVMMIGGLIVGFWICRLLFVYANEEKQLGD